jgi:hypothetical protein
MDIGIFIGPGVGFMDLLHRRDAFYLGGDKPVILSSI